MTSRPVLLTLCLPLVCGLAARAHAQSSPESPTTENSPSLVEKAKHMFEDGNRTWRPVVAIMVPGAGIGAGVTLQSPVSVAQPFGASVEGLISIYNYQQVTLRAGLLEGRGALSSLHTVDSSATSLVEAGDADARGLAVYLEHRYRRLPRMAVYGMDGPGLVRTQFGIRRDVTDLVLQWKRARRWGLGARLGTTATMRLADTGTARPADEELLARLDSARPLAVRYLTGGVGVAVDHRARTPRMRAGWLAQLAMLGFHTSDGSAASFTRLAVDARAYQPLGTAIHVMAARVLASTDRRVDQRTIPYDLQASLGGSSSLRSYSSYRFRGNHIAHLSVESRWAVHRRLALVPFLDVGRVWSPPVDQGPTGFIASYGIGVRVQHEGKTVGRLDVARGREGVRVSLGVESPF
jgi:hypothetical protein